MIETALTEQQDARNKKTLNRRPDGGFLKWELAATGIAIRWARKVFGREVDWIRTR